MVGHLHRFDDLVEQVRLPTKDLGDPIFDRVGYEETYHVKGKLSFEPVSTVDGLHLNSRVPPPIEQHDVRGIPKIQAHATRTERDKEYPW